MNGIRIVEILLRHLERNLEVKKWYVIFSIHSISTLK